jgi:hypothetical protein
VFVIRERCPICKGVTEPIYTCSFAEPPVSVFIRHCYGRDVPDAASYTLKECPACSLIYQAEIGDDAFMAELYSEWVGEGDESMPYYRDAIKDPARSRDGHELMTASAWLRVPLQSMRTLDYGMGLALWPRISNALGCDSWGFDLSKERTEFARAHGVKVGIEGRYHFINLDQILEHVPDPAGLLKSLVEHLLPGGVIKVSVPSGEGLRTDRIEEYLEKTDAASLVPVSPLQHINCFRPRSITAIAGECGLAEVRPSLAQRYAFLPSAWDKGLKELARPLVQYRMRSVLYAWLTPKVTDVIE